MLGIPTEEIAIDWTQVVFNMLTMQGHLRARDVRDLVPDDGDAAVRPRHRAGDHPPLRATTVSRRRSRWPARASPARSCWTGATRDRRRAARRPAAAGSASCAAAGLYKHEHVIETPQSAHVGVDRAGRGAEPVRQQLPRAWPTTRRSSRPRTRRSSAGASAWRRCASSAARRRCTASSRGGWRAFLGTEDDDPLQLVLRRQRRSVRDAARRRRTRSSPTRSTTPRSSTASGSARRGACATQPRHGRARGAAARRRPTPATG